MKIKKTILLAFIAIAVMLTFNACVKGDQGPSGNDGNANVIGTNSIDVVWTLDGSYFTSIITVPAITPDIVDYGLVQVFILYGNEWWSLPDNNGINSTIFGFSDGYVSLINSNSDGSTPAYPSHSTFRIVVISASKKAANPNVNWDNYKEVKIALNLED